MASGSNAALENTKAFTKADYQIDMNRNTISATWHLSDIAQAEARF
jgi:hypothetical protein